MFIPHLADSMDIQNLFCALVLYQSLTLGTCRIHSLLSEAENERMHLLSFLAIKGPSKAFRLMVIATQGVFVSMFSIGYAIAPSGCHAFVAALETEAVKTYSSILDEMDLGHLPEWGPGRQAVPQVSHPPSYYPATLSCSALGCLFPTPIKETIRSIPGGLSMAADSSYPPTLDCHGVLEIASRCQHARHDPRRPCR